MDFPGEKLVIRLWETLAEKGVGGLLTPWQIKREGKARNEVRRQELVMLAQAELDVADVRAGRKCLSADGRLLSITGPTSDTENSLSRDERTEPTFVLPIAARVAATTSATEAARAEINSAKAVLFAEEQLAGESQSPPDRQIDEDWLFAWREHAGRVSSEDLQRLWGSVLAGEIKSPGSHSVRTLEFLKTLSKDEAELISKVARYAVDGRIVRSQTEYLAQHGVPFGLLLRLQEIGVLSGVEAIGLNTQYKTIQGGRYIKALVSHRKALIVEHADEAKVLSLEVYTLTIVGTQVLGLGSFDADLDYLRAVGKGIAAQGFSVQLTDWLQVSESEGQYSNAEQLGA